MLVCLVVYNEELLHMLLWFAWWSIMGSYSICCVGLSDGL